MTERRSKAALDAWEIRLSLAKMGWHTDVRIEQSHTRDRPNANFKMGIWARRTHWNGGHADICLHDHQVFDIASADAQGRMLSMLETVHEACTRAAIEFAHSIPCMVGKLPDGRIELVENTWEASRALPPSPDLYPTEALAEDIRGHGNGGSHFAALRKAALGCRYVEDSINPYFGRPRFSRDCQDRDWGYRLRLSMRQSGDILVNFKPQEFSTRFLHEHAATSLIEASSSSLVQVFADFAAGGKHDGDTPNGLPPGFMTREAWFAMQDINRPAADQDLEP